MLCNQDKNSKGEETPFSYGVSSLEDKCNVEVTMNASEGCPVREPHSLQIFAEDNDLLISVSGLLLGSFLLLFGAKYRNIAFVSFFTLFLGPLLTVIIVECFLPMYMPSWMVWLFGYVTLGMATGLGVGAATWPCVGYLSVGTILGALCGVLAELMLVTSETSYWSWLIIIAFALVGVLLAYLCETYLISLAVAFLGSYMFIRVSPHYLSQLVTINL